MRRFAGSGVVVCPASLHVGGVRCIDWPPRTQRRWFTRWLDKVGDAVADTLSTSAVFAESRAVTESRRVVERRRPMTETLAERLHAQRDVRQHLIPTSVKVDSSKQYVTFTWPFEAQRRVTAAAAAAANEAPQQTSSDNTAAAERTAQPVATPHSHRTRVLAEYLRAYTPSTDGTFGSNMLVYGRRGVTITDIVPMGNYALRFCFSDGHTGGIYSYEYLYDLSRPGNKYHMMRVYLQALRANRKSRDPPKRAPAKRRLPAASSAPAASPTPTSANDASAYRAPAFPSATQPASERACGRQS